jgi:hypothetical protein
MPVWPTEVLKLLGFTTPFIYAAATYGFFRWLDKKASGPAKKAISGWLVPRQYDRTGIASAILELFDRVYTQPLFGGKRKVRCQAGGAPWQRTLRSVRPLLPAIILPERYGNSKSPAHDPVVK